MTTPARALSIDWAGVRDWVVDKPLSILLVVVIAFAARWLAGRLIARLVQRAERGGALAGRIESGERRTQHARAMGGLARSVATGVIVAVALVMVLDQLGVNITPILASAGILGVALGFGAQTLVKDLLSGMFMILEDQFGVGDVIDLGDASGTVEEVTLRITRLRALDGTVWYVRNGEILRVGNKSQNWARAVVDVKVAYSADIAEAKALLHEVAHGLREDDEFRTVITEEPEVTGVESLDADGVTLRVLVKTVPLEQWQVARELRQRIKSRFESAGIDIPNPQRFVWSPMDPEA